MLLVQGGVDEENPYRATLGMYQALQRTERGDVQLRAYPGMRHRVPQEMQDGDTWQTWLFRQRRH